MKYKIILKTSINTINRVGSCIDTWLKDKDYVCLTDTLTGRYNEISGSKRTDYYSAEEKTLFLINTVKDTNQFDEYDWLVFIDDDAILNVKMWEYINPYLDKDVIYGLIMPGSYNKAPGMLYPSGGSGYFISPSLIKKHNYMIDNKWGIEDAAVGKWIEQNSIKLQDFFYLDERKCHLKLNGWFPFDGERKRLNPEHESHSSLFAQKIIENITNPEETKRILNLYMTHHYIRWPLLMEYVNNCFQEWLPNNMEPNFYK